MGKFKDLTGQKFNRLTVISKADKKNNAYYWKCKCECGKKTIVRGTSLTTNRTKSCGCLHNEPYLPDNWGFWNSIWHSIKADASRRNYYFELTKEEVREICTRPCFYCGQEPQLNILKNGTTIRQDNRNGIDRVDNEQGYTIDNIVSCCTECNRSKMDRSAPDFIAHANRIVEHQKKLNGEE